MKTLGRPEVEITEFGDGQPLRFTAEVDVRPEITIPEWKGIAAEVEDTEVSDDDVDEQVQALRERFGTLVDVERPAADGDFVTIDLVATRSNLGRVVLRTR